MDAVERAGDDDPPRVHRRTVRLAATSLDALLGEGTDDENGGNAMPLHHMPSQAGPKEDEAFGLRGEAAGSSQASPDKRETSVPSIPLRSHGNSRTDTDGGNAYQTAQQTLRTLPAAGHMEQILRQDVDKQEGPCASPAAPPASQFTVGHWSALASAGPCIFVSL